MSTQTTREDIRQRIVQRCVHSSPRRTQVDGWAMRSVKSGVSYIGVNTVSRGRILPCGGYLTPGLTRSSGMGPAEGETRATRSPSDSWPLRRRPHRRGTCRSPRRSARCTGRPSITTNSDARPRRGLGHPSSNTSSLSIKLHLQVPGYHTVSTSTSILHGLVLIISIRGAFQSVSHGLAPRKAIRTA